MAMTLPRFMRHYGLLALSMAGAFLSCSLSHADSPREKLLLDPEWRFHQGDPADAGEIFKFVPNESDLMKQGEGSEARDDAIRPTLPDVMKENTGGSLSYVKPDFDESSWRLLNLPHDYAIEQEFNEKDNNNKGHRHLDRKDGSGIGWYRKSFDLSASDAGKTLSVQFDGAYRNTMVWFNGHCLGRKPSGYTSFVYDLTPYANLGGKNTLVVRTDAASDEGWFYEGAGIYRHVWLIKTSSLHVAQWGTYVTSKVDGNHATVNVETTVNNDAPTSTKAQLITTLLDASGKEIGRSEAPLQLDAKGRQIQNQAIAVDGPHLWSPEKPYLYRIVSTIEKEGKTLDIYETPFGIRTVAFDAQGGFSLNGQHRFIKGVCNHHDFAGVGAAVPDRIQQYRVQMMKEMGCDGWRMSHNPPNPELLDECDAQGMMVMDETRRFGKYPEPMSDLEAMIRRDRNHPSIVLWSLGNEEMGLQGKPAGADIVKVTQALAHQLDPSRMCTLAQNHAEEKEGFVTVIDVIGMNYVHLWGSMDRIHANNPTWRFITTEEASTVTTRGEYFDDYIKAYKSAYDVPGNTPGWGSTAESWWKHYQTRPWVGGAFVWTGFDYRGEPTPYKWPNISSHFGIVDTCGFPKDNYYYYKAWWTKEPVLHLYPHWNWNKVEHRTIRIKVSGNSEKAEVLFNDQSQGKRKLSKDAVVFPPFLFSPGSVTVKAYQGSTVVASKTFPITESTSLTADLDPVTALAETTSSAPQYDPTHPDSALTNAVSTSNQPAKDQVTISVVNEPIDIWAQSNCDEVELFVNGESKGRVKVAPNSHAEWEKIPYVPGSLEAKGYKDGKLVLTEKIETTDESAKIRLKSNREELKADKEDIALIKVDSLDAKGRFVPTAGNEIKFAIKGPGKILGVGNGDPSSHQSDIEPHRRLFNGLAMVIIQTTGKAGTIELTASGDGLKPATLSIPVKAATPRPSVL